MSHLSTPRTYEILQGYTLKKGFAVEAVLCYTAEISHHLEAQETSKNPQFQEEKISVRRKARSQVTSKKSSKIYISLFGGKPVRGLPTPPPPLRKPLPYILHVVSGKCEPQVRDLLAGGGEGGVICETVPFVNGSSDQLQIQDQDSQYYSAPLLFRQDLSISYWWLLASFSKFT
jgi:hypothetical protein